MRKIQVCHPSLIRIGIVGGRELRTPSTARDVGTESKHRKQQLGSGSSSFKSSKCQFSRSHPRAPSAVLRFGMGRSSTWLASLVRGSCSELGFWKNQRPFPLRVLQGPPADVPHEPGGRGPEPERSFRSKTSSEAP